MKYIPGDNPRLQFIVNTIPTEHINKPTTSFKNFHNTFVTNSTPPKHNLTTHFKYQQPAVFL